MTITIISTSQAPDARPIGKSQTATTSWADLITVPSYEVPDESFGGSNIVVPGVAEIISPMMVCNKTDTGATISVRVSRYISEVSSVDFMLVNQLTVSARETIPIPFNGQFIYTGDVVQILSSANSTLDVTISYTVGQAEQDDIPGQA